MSILQWSTIHTQMIFSCQFQDGLWMLHAKLLKISTKKLSLKRFKKEILLLDKLNFSMLCLIHLESIMTGTTRQTTAWTHRDPLLEIYKMVDGISLLAINCQWMKISDLNLWSFQVHTTKLTGPNSAKINMDLLQITNGHWESLEDLILNLISNPTPRLFSQMATLTHGELVVLMITSILIFHSSWLEMELTTWI